MQWDKKKLQKWLTNDNMWHAYLSLGLKESDQVRFFCRVSDWIYKENRRSKPGEWKNHRLTCQNKAVTAAGSKISNREENFSERHQTSHKGSSYPAPFRKMLTWTTAKQARVRSVIWQLCPLPNLLLTESRAISFQRVALERQLKWRPRTERASSRRLLISALHWDFYDFTGNPKSSTHTYIFFRLWAFAAQAQGKAPPLQPKEQEHLQAAGW
jgi:hypothetical protein